MRPRSKLREALFTLGMMVAVTLIVVFCSGCNADTNLGVAQTAHLTVSGVKPSEGSHTKMVVTNNSAIGVYKLTNDGSVDVEVRRFTNTDHGNFDKGAGSISFILSYSEEDSDVFPITNIASSDFSVNFESLATYFTIRHGHYRLVRVQIGTGGVGDTGDRWQIGIDREGDVQFAANEEDADYDLNGDGRIFGSPRFPATGTPQLGTIEKQ